MSEALIRKTAEVLKQGVSDELISNTARGGLRGAGAGALLGGAAAGGAMHLVTSEKAINQAAAAFSKSIQPARLPATVVAALLGAYLGARNIGAPVGAAAGAAGHRPAPPMPHQDPLDTHRLTDRERTILALLRG